MNPFEMRTLGGTGLQLTQLGLGGTSVGSLFGRISDEEGVAVVDRAYELGVRYFDTAPLYGNGSSERRFGRALRAYPRDSYVVSTKVGRYLVPDDGSGGGRMAHFKDDEPYRAIMDFSGDAVRRSLEESLERMGLDSVDIVYVHDPQLHVYQVLDETFPVLAEMKREGIVKAIGCGVNFSDVCQMLLRFADWDCFLLALRYNLLEFAPLYEFFPLCAERNVGVVIGSALHAGILASGAVPGAKFNYRSAPPAIMERVRRIERVCEAHSVPLAAAALQFPLGHRVVTSVITGTRSPERFAANAELFALAIPSAFWSDLKAEKLMPDDAPTP